MKMNLNVEIEFDGCEYSVTVNNDECSDSYNFKCDDIADLHYLAGEQVASWAMVLTENYAAENE